MHVYNYLLQKCAADVSITTTGRKIEQDEMPALYWMFSGLYKIKQFA